MGASISPWTAARTSPGKGIEANSFRDSGRPAYLPMYNRRQHQDTHLGTRLLHATLVHTDHTPLTALTRTSTPNCSPPFRGPETPPRAGLGEGPREGTHATSLWTSVTVQEHERPGRQVVNHFLCGAKQHYAPLRWGSFKAHSIVRFPHDCPSLTSSTTTAGPVASEGPRDVVFQHFLSRR